MLNACKRQAPVSTPLRAVITDSWTPYRDSVTDAILYRAISATVASRYPGGKVMAEQLSFSQAYLGGGRYSGQVKLKGVRLRSCEILPANVNK